MMRRDESEHSCNLCIVTESLTVKYHILWKQNPKHRNQRCDGNKFCSYLSLCVEVAWNWWLFETFVSGALHKLNIQFQFTLWFWLVFYACNRFWWRMQYMHKYVVNASMHECECTERVRVCVCLNCTASHLTLSYSFSLFVPLLPLFFIVVGSRFFSTHIRFVIYYGSTIRKQINILFKEKRQCKQQIQQKKTANTSCLHIKISTGRTKKLHRIQKCLSKTTKKE